MTESKGEILVVEDMPQSLALLSELLAGAGYSVRVATDGNLTLWTVNNQAPELILLDIRMPGLNGFEVCRRLKADPATVKIPVIFLSTLAAVEDKVQGLKLGAVDYITKPYQAEEVLARVHTQITLARLHKTLENERALLESRIRERTAHLEADRREMTGILAALDLAGDGIAIVAPDNTVTYANQAMITTVGIDRLDEILGRAPETIVIDGATVIDPLEINSARDTVRRLGRWSGELSLRAGEHHPPRTVLAHLRALPDGGRVAVLTDITEARRRETERRRQEQHLDQARKLEALGQLAAGVAHDFNNLLGAILGFAQFIIEDTGEDTPQHRYASRIVKAGQQAKSLIGQIMAFSNRYDSAPELIDLCALINDNLSILKAIIPASTTLTLNTEACNCSLAGHRSQITQILVNLTINGSDALHGNAGTVTIDVSVAEQDGNPTLTPVEVWTDADGFHHSGLGVLLRDARYLRLSVTDSGDGMNEEVLSHIFDPFFTTKSKTGGTGLGLAVVHSAVASHGGGLLVRTAPGRGSRFDVLLPLAEAASPAGAETRTVQPVAHRGSILLVDDSTAFGEMLMTALFRLGYEISVCEDPMDALSYVEEDPTAWDLVVTDQAMPNMNGTELLAAIKAIRPDLPCILCTAFPGDITKEVAREAGADGFATKPLDMGRFSVMVKELIAK